MVRIKGTAVRYKNERATLEVVHRGVNGGLHTFDVQIIPLMAMPLSGRLRLESDITELVEEGQVSDITLTKWVHNAIEQQLDGSQEVLDFLLVDVFVRERLTGRGD